MVRAFAAPPSQPVRMKMVSQSGSARAEMRLKDGPDSRLREGHMNGGSECWKSAGF
jgi:hypothetical protein